MFSRRTGVYNAVFAANLRVLPSAPAVTTVVSDFELALLRSVRIIFPQVQHRGCAFHWAQAVWRQLSQLGLLLLTSFFLNSCIFSMSRIFYSMHESLYNVHATPRNILIKTVGRSGHDSGSFCTCDGPFRTSVWAVLVWTQIEGVRTCGNVVGNLGL